MTKTDDLAALVGDDGEVHVAIASAIQSDDPVVYQVQLRATSSWVAVAQRLVTAGYTFQVVDDQRIVVLGRATGPDLPTAAGLDAPRFRHIMAGLVGLRGDDD